ncbi:ATP-dependent Clp protease proteolytic subunit-related protein 2, chloroplastic [Vitis vinifera]|uniref:ATP-dependent Clp protease proteolytic subunit n=1 Tax=Vitis vinifera TaxID=29760 RepID=A0A438K2S8_VITVI|nr:ATP-dependent Clp protease proteolytic subunit-related protein 2, chloroplastic [Vitis vinifera]RVX15507.1 ATP-dependent Clp protease proteolytic subunit-related protein 2, chloroplastic [Vitis vinifera]
MAVHLHSTPSSSSSLHSRTRVSQPPLSCATKLFSGLKLQSASTFGTGKPNLTVEFFNKVHKSVQSRCFASIGWKSGKTTWSSIGCACWTSDSKSTRARVRMMPIGTPRVPYRTPGEGTWQWVDLWNALYRERVIYIGQHIDEEFSNQLLATMLYLDSIESSKRMFFYINSPGGDLTPSLAIYDTMQSLKSPVGTNCLGFAYNLATFLLAAGEKGNRLAMPLSRIALQSPAGAARGQADDIRNEANELLRIRDYLFSELANKTGQPIDKINKDLRRMKRFNAQEALEYGLIDRILRPPRVKADAPRKDAGTGLGTMPQTIMVFKLSLLSPGQFYF